MKKWNEVVFADFPSIGKITQKTIDAIKGSRLRFRGSVRMYQGMILTDKAYAKEHRNAEKLILP